MPISLSQLATNTAQVVVPVGEQSIHITYYPARVTERTLRQIQAFDRQNDESIVPFLAEFNQILASLIASWDIYEDDEQTRMFPVDAARMEELPLVLRVQIVGAIMADLRPEALAAQMPS